MEDESIEPWAKAFNDYQAAQRKRIDALERVASLVPEALASLDTWPEFNQSLRADLRAALVALNRSSEPISRYCDGCKQEWPDFESWHNHQCEGRNK